MLLTTLLAIPQVPIGCRQPAPSASIRPLTQERLLNPAATGPASPHRAPGAAAQTISLFAAINETVSFVFSVAADDQSVTLSDLRVDPFVSAAGENVPLPAPKFFRMHTVNVPDWPGWHLRSVRPADRRTERLDVLVPVRAPSGGLPCQLAPRETAYFWADVAIPKGTPAGTYSTDVVATSPALHEWSIPVHLTIHPLVLPNELDIPFIVDLDHRTLTAEPGSDAPRAATSAGVPPPTPPLGGADTILAKTLQLLRSHGLTPNLPHLSPSVRIGTDGAAVVDFETYDAIAAPCLDGTLFADRPGVPLWPLPLRPVREALARAPGPPSPSTRKLLIEYLNACQEHFEARGWFGKSFAFWPAGADRQATIRSIQRFAGIARQVATPIPISVQLYPQDMTPFGWEGFASQNLEDAVDIWIPPAQFFDSETMRVERDKGRQTWLSIDRPPFSGSIAISAAPTDVRVLSWQASKLGAQAVYLGSANPWPDDSGPRTPSACLQYDPQTLLYPGKPYGLNMPVASVRLKHLRRSLQDAAYCQLLAQQGLAHIANTVRDSLAPYAGIQACRTHYGDGRPSGWAREWATFEAARSIMIAALRRSSQSDPPHAQEALRETAQWRAFMEATRTVRARTDGARVQLDSSKATAQMRLEWSASVWNGRRAPFEASARMELPINWATTADPPVSVSLAPNQFGRTTSWADIAELPAATDGIYPFRGILEEPDGLIHEVPARLAFLTALPFRGNLNIDGDLSDWPPGSTNVAANFRLITGPAVIDGHEDAAQPTRATMAFVLRDDRNLYVAINCAVNAGSDGPTFSRKGIEYDDLIPTGEELIEILLDPLNGATRSPSDLFHIVIKSTGTDLVEKGIRTNPPVAKRIPWTVDLEVATRRRAGRWTTELRIPLSAFETSNTDRTVWGFNITRFDVENKEFSTWSGAIGNAYDPLSLGNMQLP